MQIPSVRSVGKTAPLQLALQGGGAHGAFTWGVLDRLLDEERVEIGQISGTSAGALNGAALVSGLLTGGRAEAKDHLSRLWHAIAAVGTPMTWLMTRLRKPGLGVWDDAMPLLSPYKTNPLAMEPVRALLAGVVDINAINAPGPNALFVNAVNVNTGRCRVFGPGEHSLQTILASACAPWVFQAVVIDGQSYWDGGYAGNPSLWSLYQQTLKTNILLVELTPLERTEAPTTAKNILNRINEIASIQGLMAELQAIDVMNRTVREADIKLHVVSMPDSGSALDIEPSIKRTVALELFYTLRERGHATCDEWLETRSGKQLPAPADIGPRFLGCEQPNGRRAAQCDPVYDGHQALQLARALLSDVILLDIGLPGMDGYQVARSLRGASATSRIRLVALTGYGQPKDVKRAKDAGFDHHLVKPVDLEVVTALVGGAAGRQPS